MYRNFFLSVGLAAVSLLFFACGGRSGHVPHGVNEMEHAELAAIYDRGEYEEVYIVSPDGREAAHYFLLDSGDSIPADMPENAIVLRIPLSSLAIDSEVYASALEELGAIDAVKGIFDAQFATSKGLKSHIDSGKIVNLGAPASPSIEKLIDISPDALMVSYYDGMQITGVDHLGIPVIKMYDIQEISPLGRAEWLRFIGRLVGKREEADSVFEAVKNHYREIKSSVHKDAYQPKILTETPYEGIWYVPGGASYQANMIKDAGGKYFKASDSSVGSLHLTVEQVLDGGCDADIWLIKSFGNVPTLHSLAEENEIYTEFKPYKTGDIYCSDTYDSGLFREFPFHPDLLLEDYRIIFSGDTLSTPRYFNKIRE